MSFAKKILLLLLLFSSTLVNAEDNLTKLTTSNNEFGLQLFKILQKESPQQNVFISPLSINMALAMTYNGAVGTTKAAFAKTLKLQTMDIKSVNESYLTLGNSLQNSPDVQIALANSLWVSKDNILIKDFQKRMNDYYHAEVRSVDFGSPLTVNQINNWVKDHTSGKIYPLLDVLHPQSSLVLVNAVYFKGKWTNPFNKSLTTEKPFYLANDKNKLTPMMSKTSKFSYLETNQFQAVELPYGKQNHLSMYVFLSKANYSIEQFVADFSFQKLSTWLNQFHPQDGTIQLPRFKLSYETSLAKTLEKLGMQIAFGSNANFSDIVLDRRVFISDVIHKAVMDVNEEGTEAAAATAVVMIGAAVVQKPIPPFSFIANRPFFCLIVDNQTKEILFMGVVYQPE